MNARPLRPSTEMESGETKYTSLSQGVSLPCVRVYVHVAGIEGGEILEKVSALAWIYAEIGQGALHHAPPPSA